MKFLIDECLTPQLTVIAQARGHEAGHVVWLGMGGKKDWNLMPFIVDGDWTFVTRNSVDFRGRANASGPPGLWVAASAANLHPANGRRRRHRSGDRRAVSAPRGSATTPDRRGQGLRGIMGDNPRGRPP